MILVIEGVEVDLVRKGVWRDERLHRLTPRGLEALLYLVDHRERIVSVDELREQVWEGRKISASSVSEAIRNARGALGERASGDEFIESIHGHGYRFLASNVRRMWVVRRDPKLLPRFDQPEPLDRKALDAIAVAAVDSALAGHVRTIITSNGPSAPVREQVELEAQRREMRFVSVDCRRLAQSSTPFDAIARDIGISRSDRAHGGHAKRRVDLDRLVRDLRREAAATGIVVSLRDLDDASDAILLLVEELGSLPVAARILVLASCVEPAEDVTLGPLIRRTAALVLEANRQPVNPQLPPTGASR